MRGRKVLVLSSSYHPIGVISIKRAICMIVSERAERLHTDPNTKIRSPSVSFDAPLVVRTVNSHNTFRHLYLPPTKENIFLRDRYTCQYCGRVCKYDEATIDHIIPKSRGGQHTWKNLVTACPQCNNKKGNRLPEEAGMTLLKRTYTPLWISKYYQEDECPEEWLPYLYL